MKTVYPLPHIGYCLECGQPIRGIFHPTNYLATTGWYEAVKDDLHVHILTTQKDSKDV